MTKYTPVLVCIVLYSVYAMTDRMREFKIPHRPAANQETTVIELAEKVLQKGLEEIDLGTYPGILLMHAMSELAGVHPQRKMLRQAVELYEKYGSGEIQGRGSFICYEAGGSGAALLYYWKEADMLARQIAEAAQRMVKDQKRSSEGLLVPHWVKDSLDQVFIDMAFAVTPFLLYCGLALSRDDYIDLAVFETLELVDILRDNETGLVHQGRGFQGLNVISADNWSRGNGWGAFALAILVRDLPEDHPMRPEVIDRAKDFFLAVLRYQDRDGMWHQEMTDTTSFVETSGSGLMIYGTGIMLEEGILDRSFREQFIRGLKGLCSYVGNDGSVSHTSRSLLCPGKGGKEDYKNWSWTVNDPHSFGPVVLAFTQAAKMGMEKARIPQVIKRSSIAYGMNIHKN
jgi:rhamnogalacturonyl hydrolase YesR